MGIVAKYEKWKKSVNVRWVAAVFFVLLLVGLVGLTTIPKSVGYAINLDPEDVDQLIFYLLEILKIMLGYLLGRKVRSIFDV